MKTKINRDAVLAWFRGKARDNATKALNLLAESERQGFWIKGASRKVRASLNKQALAVDFMHERGAYATHDRWYRETGNPPAGGAIQHLRLKSDERMSLGSGYSVSSAMEFGQVDKAARLRATVQSLIAEHGKDDRETASMLRTAKRWVETFAPVAELMAELDELRPKPEYVIAKMSPTVYKTMKEAGLDFDFTSVEIPKTEWKLVEVVVKGEKVKVWFGYIIWPDGTVHDTSRFATREHAVKSRAQYDQCHACGHGIPSGNFIPLILRDGGVPHALWVGRDCAETVFGVKVSAEAKFEREMKERNK